MKRSQRPRSLCPVRYMEGMNELSTHTIKEIQNVNVQPTSLLLAVSEAADFIGITEKALRRRIERGQISVVRCWGRVYLRRSDLLKIVREGCGLSPER
jgi:hypothetical protein